jgi:hypothetical protein
VAAAIPAAGGGGIVDDGTIARIGYNEARFRSVNEDIGRLALAAGPRMFEIVCECGAADCTKLITVTPEAYRAVRAQPDRFFVKPGHQIEAVETVVEVVDSDLALGSYLVVSKRAGLARQIAEETDPTGDAPHPGPGRTERRP